MTYKAKFTAEGDKLNGNYTTYISLYNTANGAMTGGELHAHVLAAGLQVPKVYLVLVKSHNDYSVQAIHRPTAYTRDPTTPTQWDGHNFAFINDVLPGNFINLVPFPDNAFDVCQPQRVPTIAQTTAALTTLPANEPNASHCLFATKQCPTQYTVMCHQNQQQVETCYE